MNGSRKRYDVIVVGARTAGAATARLLAEAGHDVVMVDRAMLPSDTTSTHALVRGGVVQLHRWGLLDSVLASGAPAIRSATFHRYDAAAPAPLRLAIKAGAGVDHMLAPRRRVLDDILVRAAVRAGVQLLDRTRLLDVLRDATGRVTGVQVVDADGHRSELSAGLVVGADGVRSRVADLVEAPLIEQHARSGSCFYTYVGDVAWDGFEFHLGDRVFAGAFPTHDDAACVWLMQPVGAATTILAAGGRRTHSWLGVLRRTVPELGDRVAAGTIRDRLRGAVGLPNQLRRPHGPGWALVGDAGYHRDPITSHGITDAFRDAELLAEALDLVLRQGSDEAAALEAYQQQRDAAVADTFALTRELGAFPAAEQFAALQVRLSRALDAEATALAARPAPRTAPASAAG